MKTFSDIPSLRTMIKEKKKQDLTIGLVPTMGFLHEGHMSLVRKAKATCDVVVVSIFVNPTQFGPNEDLESYPRDIDGDEKKCQQNGADYIFYPTVETMYPKGASTIVECEGPITKTLCGKSRETHFKGVTTIVAKLFNIVSPDYAFFGQKDAQQVAVIKKMVRELNFDVTIVPCPIQREVDGLAMSSRNVYLTQKEREDALVLSQSLEMAKASILNGTIKSNEILDLIRDHIQTVSTSDIDYIQVVNANTLEDIDTIKGEVLIAMAVRFGKSRLLDNMQMTI